MSEALATRFWSKVRKAPGDGCWEWQGGLCSAGYGSFRIRGRNEFAHRTSWLLAVGPVPAGLWVLHRCDNPRCVCPDHLFLGTAADNSADMVTKGRSLKGDRNPARLHPERLARGDHSGKGFQNE